MREPVFPVVCGHIIQETGISYSPCKRCDPRKSVSVWLFLLKYQRASEELTAFRSLGRRVMGLGYSSSQVRGSQVKISIICTPHNHGPGKLQLMLGVYREGSK